MKFFFSIKNIKTFNEVYAKYLSNFKASSKNISLIQMLVIWSSFYETANYFCNGTKLILTSRGHEKVQVLAEHWESHSL